LKQSEESVTGSRIPNNSMSGILKKLFASHIIVIIISFGILTVTIGYSINSYYEGIIVSKLELSVKMLREILKESLIKNDVRGIQDAAKKMAAETNARITVINPNGTVIGDSTEDPRQMENHRSRPEIRTAMSGKIGRNIHYSHILKVNMLYVAMPVVENGKLLGIIRVSEPLSDVKAGIKHIRRIILLAILIGLIIAFGLSFFTSASFVKPLLEMKDTAEEMARGKYHQKLDINSSDELGNLAASFNILSDEVQKKITEITEDKNKLLAILSSMVEGVIVIDADNQILITNHSFSDMFHIPFKSIEGKYYWEVIKSNEICDIIGASIKSREPLRKEISIKDVQSRVFLIQISNIVSTGSNFLGIVAVFHDITQLKKLEQLRSEFVANVSHEIKTPVTAIAGAVETLIGGAMNDEKEAREFLDIVLNHSHRLNNIVNDLLTLSKIEAENTKIDAASVDLKKIINSVSKLFEEGIHSKKQSIAIDIPADMPIIMADGKKLEQVFFNLLDNAIKFTPENGRISVKAENLEKMVKIDISDTGTGIPAEHIGRIFERFHRVDAARSREMGGTGLGLAIVKHIINLHKGRIKVTSRIGEGSTFSVFLPKIS